ncbi:serine hydrolase domain-containing protein [Draconibacterium sp. IB214405]|uniref:serine hydrolase domain-containing protein n=1 Tax=Draconibacterium sp. IB214405 TaxID=3097352 RepID=UPI002A171CB1|nr:serine hydrolase domain-containing protein [Draconibacterium sp. IB214405]MDX8339060.1 serine hydrolase domain-containing protein [Draconibacterium sp. IB214405]
MKRTLSILLAAMFFAFACTHQPAETGTEQVVDVQSSQKKSEMTKFINPVFNDTSAEDNRRFKEEFGVASSLSANPTAAWFHDFTSRALPTAVVPRRQPTMNLQSEIIPAIGKVIATTSLGEMDLNAFLNNPESFAQGFVVMHKGKIVFEQYPGMRKENSHLTASTAKVFVGLLIECLIEEGLIDEQKTLGDYVPEFKESVWEPIKVIDVMDMTTGLDPIDGPEHFVNPDAVITRMVMAELGETYKGNVESMLDVMKHAKTISKPGEHFTYSSTATQALVVLTEAVTKQTWADAFDQRIWSKMGVDGPLMVHLSPDGYALGHGVLSLRLRDLARFGMLYTPSWYKIAVEPIVNPDILERARVPYRTREFYRAGPSGEKFMERLGDFDVRSAGRQWDAVWEDGDFFKSGLNTQGIYVSPDRDLVIAYFSLEPTQQLQKYLRPLVTSGLFDQ